MFGKLLKLAAIAVCASTAVASFTYTQMGVFTRSTAEYLNSFSYFPSTCLNSNSINQLPAIVNGVCSAADNIDFFNIEGEPNRVANLFSQSSSMLNIMSNAFSNCNINLIKTLIQSKSTELGDWATQIQSGASVSLSQVSVVNDLKSMVANLQIGYMSAAGYDLGESIQYDM